MTLPSNVVSPSYHKNTTSHFITHLPKTLEVRDYEVALCEICYPHSYDNIYTPINKMIFEKNVGLPNHVTKSRNIPPAYYQTTEAIVIAINEQKPASFKGEFSFEKDGRIDGRKRVKVVLFEGERLELHPTLAKLLGFNDHKWEAVNIFQTVLPTSLDENEEDPDNAAPIRNRRDSRLRFKAERQGDMNSLLYNIFVYSSICKESLVGNDYYPLLRTVSVEGEEGQYIHKTFETGHYVRLMSDYLHRIDIRLTNDQGEPIHFAYGKAIVKLHFRKKSILA